MLQLLNGKRWEVNTATDYSSGGSAKSLFLQKGEGVITGRLWYQRGYPVWFADPLALPGAALQTPS